VLIAVSLFASVLDVPGAGRYIHFAADQGIDALFPALLVEAEDTEHVSMVGNGKVLHPQGCGLFDHPVDAGCTIQETEIGMIM
jgi:hypothetical protein